MPVKIHIPTPLRPFTDKLDAVELDGATIGELLTNLTTKFGGLKQHLYQRRRQAAQLRQRLRQRRRHPLSAEGSDAAQAGRHGEHHPVGRRRRRHGGQDATGRSAPALPELSGDEIKRYSRHLIMPEVGMDGQRKLKAAKVLCIGAGGLGSPAAMYLAAAGVGTLGIVDFDVVDFSNLQRQILHGTPDVGRSKLDVGEGSPERAQPERAHRDLRDGAELARTRCSCSSRTT